jgi:hypothetical protein
LNYNRKKKFEKKRLAPGKINLKALQSGNQNGRLNALHKPSASRAVFAEVET